MVVVMAAASFALYFWGAGRSFGYDEANTVGTFVRQGDLLRPFNTQAVFNNHPLFSFAETVVGKLASTDEPVMRLLPALFGAATVALFAWWAQRRYGTLAAVSGAIVLATCPLFVTEVRQARGYAVVAFAALVASIVLVDDIRSRRGRVVYVVAVAAGVATHLYMLIVVAAHVAYLLARRPLDRRRVADVALGVAVGGIAYIGLWRAMIDGAEERGNRYRPEFPSDLARDLLGRHSVAITALAILAAVAGWTLVRRRELVAALTLPVVLVWFVWQVVQPTDLYPRFLIAAALPLAATVAWSVHRHGWLAPLAVTGAVFALVTQRDDLRREPPIRDAAVVVASARELGLRPCAMGFPAIGAYTEAPPRYTNISQVPDCDVVVQVNVFGDPRMEQLKAVYPHAWVFRGQRVVSTVSREDLEAAFRGFD
jgi:hypothetical protein